MSLTDTILRLFQEPIFIISIIFWAITFILAKLLSKKKENVVLFFPFLVLFKSKLFNRIFQKISRKGQRFWKVWWNIGIIVSFLFMIYAIYFFVSNFILLIIDPKPENAIIPIIPGVTIGLPIFSYLILPILFSVSIHEFSHAIAAELDGVNVKSSGIFGAGIFFIIGFGAFVEVDEFQLNSKTHSTLTRLRVASAGIWSNLILAGIVFLLILGFPTIMKVGYYTEGFRINYVLSANEGGFNDLNLETGDIVYKINDTVVDVNNNANLNDILTNKTDLKVTIGDQLEFSCISSETGEKYIRNVTLGFNSFVGFEWTKINNSAINITNVYSWLRAGNNYNLDLEGQIITKINDTLIDYQNNWTFEMFLKQKIPCYKINITSDKGKTYEINVDFYSNIPGAHLLNDIYIGVNIEKYSNNSIIITEVFNNDIESGINEDNILENTVITKINGIQISIANQSFKDFIYTSIAPQPGDVLIFTDQDNNHYSLSTTEKPITPVFIGIQTEPYWVPSNWIGRLVGGLFPNEIDLFLLFTLIISLSLALFNLLPIAIFDGGRMVKEIIDIAFGNKNIEKKARKMLHYEYDLENPKQHLFTHSVNEVINVREILQINNEYESNRDDNIKRKIEEREGKRFSIRELLFKSIDTSNDGYIDTIEILEDQNLKNKNLIEVEVMFEQDLKEHRKRNTYRTISWFLGIILIASMIISIIKFGNSLFWL